MLHDNLFTTSTPSSFYYHCRHTIAIPTTSTTKREFIKLYGILKKNINVDEWLWSGSEARWKVSNTWIIYFNICFIKFDILAFKQTCTNSHFTHSIQPFPTTISSFQYKTRSDMQISLYFIKIKYPMHMYNIQHITFGKILQRVTI